MFNSKTFLLKYVEITFVLLLLLNCATVPTSQVTRPWVRTLESNKPPNIGAKLTVKVSSITSLLLGNDQISNEKIQGYMHDLLRRRGFIMQDSFPDYLVNLYYKTERGERFHSSMSITSFNTLAQITAASSGASTYYGLGTSIAGDICRLAMSSGTSVHQSIEKVSFYTHTIAIDINNQDSNTVWKGDATWDSRQLDLINQIQPVIQLILSSLPSDQNIRPEIAEVKRAQVENYFNLECKGKWFTCPALPYPISFLNSSIRNTYAFAAYNDLIQTAEYALPNGNDNDWKNPLQISLWKEVTLGGQYLVGPDHKQANVLIKLRGKKEGYNIEVCWVASDEEYTCFQDRMKRWQQVLKNYYDVYQH